MARNFCLIDTEHESVEDSGREIVIVNLLTFMRRLRAVVVILEEEEEPV